MSLEIMDFVVVAAVAAVVVIVVPSLAQDLRVPCCPGCRQSGDGRAKEGTGDGSAGTGWQDQG